MADGDPLIIGKPNNGSSETSLTASIFGSTLTVENKGGGTNSALFVKYIGPQSGGPAIAAQANVSGLHTTCTDQHGDSIVGEALATSGTATGVKGFTEGASIFSQEPRVLCGVHGFANTGTGVRGDSISGFGVSAASPKGVALKVEGKAAFSTAGEGSVTAGKSSATVANTLVTSKSHITVTLTDNPGDDETTVGWVSRNPGVGFVVHLTDEVHNPTSFTYLIVEPTS